MNKFNRFIVFLLLVLVSCSDKYYDTYLSESLSPDSASCATDGTGGSGSSDGLGGSNSGSSGSSNTSGFAGSNNTSGTTGVSGFAGSSGSCGSNLASKWDYVGLVSDGQSLSVGYIPPGSGSSTMSLTQPGCNVMLHDSGPYNFPPNGTGAIYSAVPLVAQMRPGVLPPDQRYSYPTNLPTDGEAPDVHMANEVSRLWGVRGGGEYCIADTNVGVSGANLSQISKGGYFHRSYEGALEEVTAWKNLFHNLGKTYGVAAIPWTHGEVNGKDATYGSNLETFYQGLNTDIKSITGQSEDVLLLMSQESSLAGGFVGSPMGMWLASQHYPNQMILTGPKYQYPYADGKHLTAIGYQALGAKYAQVFDLVFNQGQVWRPLEPISSTMTTNNTVINIKFRVPYPPLQWDNNLPPPWKPGARNYNARGFEVHDTAGVQMYIDHAAIIAPDTVQLVLYRVTTVPLTVSYATTGVMGHLMDSDPTQVPEGYNMRNYCIHFAQTVNQ